eukprot:CAMPEP_0197031138 /NCGR_PEP_ID=MMETSP1384-20130603/10229_1 /TAXON_ID=29189 /ORGANISM="Ammonia sp." /LENGTH=658 /DNA_ID=CAMNT_0042460625 /DNA_START=22 /DNA_END=1998 /DNA_ORIENTATION=+
MDDADGIIIPILRSIGCEIAENVKSAAQFEAGILVHSLGKCLHKIDDQKYEKIPEKLPTSIAKRVQCGTLIANAFKDLGYRGEVGYDKVIYPNEKDTRSLLRFMVQKLPKEGGGGGKRKGSVEEEEEDLDEGQALDRRIHDNLKDWIKTKYSFLSRKPHVSQFRTTSLDYPLRPAHAALSKQRVKYCKSDSLNFVPAQTIDYEWLVPSILSHNHREYLAEQAKTYIVAEEDEELIREIFGDEMDAEEADTSLSQMFGKCIGNELNAARKTVKENSHKRQGAGSSSFASQSRSNLNLKNTGFQLQKNYTQQEAATAQAVDDSGKLVKIDETGNEVEQLNDEEQEEQRKQELDQMKSAIVKLQERLRKMDVEIEKQQESFESKQKLLEEEKKRCEELQKQCITKKKTIDLIPNAQDNLRKLQKIVENSQARLDELRAKWEDKKSEFLQQFQAKKDAMEQRKQRANDLLAEIKNMRKEMRECANEIREKETSISKMVNKLNKLPKTIDRQVYVERILGVVQNLENQNKQIRQILDDVNNLQRDTNQVVEKSKRTFGVVDNMVFTAASNAKDINAKRQLNQIYRQVVSMREYFDTLVDTARTISNTQNEIRDLEYQIVALREKVESLEMKKIKNDLKEVEDENEELATKLKALKKQLKKIQR